MIQDSMRELQRWAEAGIRITNLSKDEAYNSKEGELTLLRYCYYRLMWLASKSFAENPKYEHDIFAQALLSLPFGPCVSKEAVADLCKLLMIPDFRVYISGYCFGNCWMADDVAGSIVSLQGNLQENDSYHYQTLWEAAKKDQLKELNRPIL